MYSYKTRGNSFKARNRPSVSVDIVFLALL